jgi:hypothetical protein
MDKILKVILIVFLMMAFFASTAMADPFTRRPHNYTAKQTYWKSIVVRDSFLIMDTYEARCDISATSDFTISGTRGKGETNTILIDPSLVAKSNGVWPCSYGGSGVTVNVPAVTKEIDGLELTFINSTGTTGFALYGTAINTSSGTTHGAGMTSPLWPDAIGDSITVVACYDSAVSWYVKNATIKEEYYFGSGAEVDFVGAPVLTNTALSWASGTGFSVPTNMTTGVIYTLDITDATDSNEADADIWAAGVAGVTLVLPTPTASNDKKVFAILKTDSGTTDGILYAGGLPINSASGTTNTGLEMDAIGDIIWLMPAYNSAVSYFIVNHYVH